MSSSSESTQVSATSAKAALAHATRQTVHVEKGKFKPNRPSGCHVVLACCCKHKILEVCKVENRLHALLCVISKQPSSPMAQASSSAMKRPVSPQKPLAVKSDSPPYSFTKPVASYVASKETPLPLWDIAPLTRCCGFHCTACEPSCPHMHDFLQNSRQANHTAPHLSKTSSKKAQTLQGCACFSQPRGHPPRPPLNAAGNLAVAAVLSDLPSPGAPLSQPPI